MNYSRAFKICPLFLLLGVFQLSAVDEEERLNLYDRNRRNLEWERRHPETRHGYNEYSNTLNRQHQRDQYYRQSGTNDFYRYYNQGRNYRTISEPDMAPPE